MGLKSRWGRFQRWLMDGIARKLSHILVPDIAKVVSKEMASDAFDNTAEIPQTIRIEDNGAPITVVSFSSGGL